jgi:glycosyltransferase involved in cell wall biosynthesis
MKLVITIPAFNEEKTITKVIKEIPRSIAGVNRTEVLVIDDGSTDKTASLAKKAGAKVIRNKKNLGLAKSFRNGLNKALEMKADIIVNTDADFQYNQKQIPLIVAPVLRGEADICLGSRFKGKIEYMPLRKRLGNKIASAVLSFVTGYRISDGQTGFRAFSRPAALKMNLWSGYTYTHETLLHAAENDLVIKEVPVDFRKRKDRSRLMSGILHYALNAGKTLFNYYLYYRPLTLFGSAGIILSLSGMLIGSRVLIHFAQTGQVTPYIPSAILTAVLLILGFLLILTGLTAEITKHQRQAVEEVLERLRG